MTSPIDSSMAKVKVRRYGDSVTCEVIVLFRGQDGLELSRLQSGGQMGAD
jgi:hypothetical protein